MRRSSSPATRPAPTPPNGPASTSASHFSARAMHARSSRLRLCWPSVALESHGKRGLDDAPSPPRPPILEHPCRSRPAYSRCSDPRGDRGLIWPVIALVLNLGPLWMMGSHPLLH